MPTEEGLGSGEVTCEVRVEATPETVFGFFTDPALMVRWKGVEATLRPEPGGIYRVLMPGGQVALGEYVELDPPTRLVFTWGWEGEEIAVEPGASTVEVTLTRDGESTLVRLVHGGLPAPLRGPHHVGWRHYLDRLATAAAGGDPGDDDGPPATDD